MNQTEAPNPHHHEASMAVFAHAELDALSRRRVFNSLGSMVLDVIANDENHELPGFAPDDLRYFKSQRSPQEQERVDYRESLLKGCGPFNAEVERIKTQLETRPAKEIEGFLASGNESDVFTVENSGKPFALRISKNRHGGGAYNSAEHIDSYLEGVFHAANIDGMEKLVGLSYEKGATVGEIIPGKPMAEYAAEEIAAIPQKHYKKLAMTVVQAAKAGISLDGNEGNLLYDTESGFGFVDFDVTATENRGIAQPATTSVFGTDTWLPNGEIPASEHEEDYIVLQEVLAATIPTYERWIEILYEVQEEMGLDSDYLTRLEELQKTLVNMKAALEELTHDGAVQELVRKSQISRQDSIEKFQIKVTKSESDFMRESAEKSLNRRMQVPGRIFPKGSVRPSRNDNR
ncbi:hypothetical protein KA068_00025 [Candidatus Saccharibacteria bacterium]|nr:hypothetical protein [Candidatus Saccharibacteria bacterium]